MESESDQPAKRSAQRQLKTYEAVRSRVKTQGPSRAFALFTLWSAIVVAMYVGVFLFSFGNRTVSEAVDAGGYAWNGILVFPILVFSSLASGARERFGIRTKPPLGHWIVIGLVIVGFVVLAWLSLSGVDYPWALNLLMMVTIFFTIASRSIRQLRDKRASNSDRWEAEPLNRSARCSTALIGLVMGLLVATSTQTWFPLLSAVVMMLLAVMLMGWQTRWGFPSTGYEWAPIHWVAFGITISMLFLMTILLSRTAWITTPISLATGVFILLVMLSASLLPLRAGHKQL
ncbi:hypothetical protein CQ018_07620 [Arthrobacter sp. MYb227]|uniref:hypothetical protein n=1 Tax=Arthrobacter sp. MYb227 TaxID=1848601 RepID=UPI000CFB92C1|nr:hypothetical protein [Arthrobacter sp. MYb227]PQZ93537.1 hypothetical protein CQ018_07620 [Arthrobacter sp. MYb227]